MLRNKLVPLRGDPTIKTGGLLPMLNGLTMAADGAICFFQTALLIPGGSVSGRMSFHVLIPISQARGRGRLLPHPPIPPELLFRNLRGLHPVIPDTRKLLNLSMDSVKGRKPHTTRQGQNR